MRRMLVLIGLLLLSACTLPSGIGAGKAFNPPGVVSFVAPTPADAGTIFVNQATIAAALPSNTQLCTLSQEDAKSVTGSGKDGALVVAQQGQVVNTYTSPTIALAVGMTSIPVVSSAGFSAGDVVLFVNVRSGINERKEVFSAGNNVLNFLTGIAQNYPVAETQVVRLPQFTSVTVQAGASIGAPVFNGVIGGIAGFLANGVVTVNGAISVDAVGYAGGTGLGVCSGRCPLPGGTGGQGPSGGGPTGCAGEGAGGSNFATADQLILGSGGAGGMCTSRGGAGGGIVYVIANSVVVSRLISANGGAGQGGTFSGGAYAAGGGAGGVVHLEAQTLTLGTNLVTAIGGAGGFDSFNANFGGTGGSGLVRLKGTVQGTTNPVASTGAFTQNIPKLFAMNLVNGGEVATVTLNNLVQGVVRYSVICNTGSTAIKSFTVTFEATPPATTASGTANGQAYVFGSQSIVPVTVSFACADAGSGCASTKFCTGAAVCSPTTLFVQPISISQIGTTQVCFSSTDNAGNAEPTVCTQLVIVAPDSAAPTTTASATTNGVAYVFGATSAQAVVTTLSCADAGIQASGCQSTLFCTNQNLDCNPLTQYASGQQIITNTAGTTKLCFASKDAANNQEPTTCKTIVIQFPVISQDTVVPTTTPAATALGQVYQFGSSTIGPVVVALFCADAGNPVSGCASTKFCTGLNVNCNPAALYDGQQILVSAVGTTKLCFQSVDVANNRELVVCKDILIVAPPNLQDIVASTTTGFATTNGLQYVFGTTAITTVISTLACVDAGNPVSGCQVTLFCSSANVDCVPSVNYAVGQQIVTNTAGTTKLCFASKDVAGNQEPTVCKAIIIQFPPNVLDVVVPVTSATGSNNGIPYAYGTSVFGSVISTLACVDAGVPTSGCAATKFCTNLNIDCVPNLNYAPGQQLLTNVVGTTRLCFSSSDAQNNVELTKCVSIVLQVQNNAVDTVAPTTIASATVNGQQYVYGTPVQGTVVNSLFCGDAGAPISGCASTKFCTSAAPCVPNTIFAGQFISVNAVGTTKLCFQSVDVVGNQEIVVCKDIVVVAAAQDVSPPVTSASATSNGAEYVYGIQTQSGVISTLACADVQSGCASTLFCSSLNVVCVPNLVYAQGQQIVTSNVGTTKLCFASKDAANNQEATVCKDIVIVAPAQDVVPPLTIASATSNGVQYVFGAVAGTAVISTLACVDAGNPVSGCQVTLFCSSANIDCVPGLNYAVGQQIVTNTAGITKLCFASKDVAGNQEPTICKTITIQFPVNNQDLAAPVTSANASSNNLAYVFGTTSVNQVFVSLSCADASSGCRNTVFCTNQNTDCVPAILFTNQPIVINQQGTTRVCFRSSDIANNLEPTTCLSVVLNIAPVGDAIVPVTTAQFLNGNLPYIFGSVAQNFVSFTLNCVDQGSGCKQTLLCTAPGPCVPNIPVPQGINPLFAPVVTQSGATNVCFASVDNANNQEQTICKVVQRPDIFC